jgi:hypothetical protein
MLSAKKITLSATLAMFAVSTFATGFAGISFCPSADAQSVSAKSAAKPAAAKEEKKDEKKETAKAPEPSYDNAITVTPDELVKRPHEFLNKTLKFTAKFSSFSNLALDYKPAMKSSKTNLSFLVLTPGSHVPLSELKLAMAIPKEKDPETELLGKLKDGDTVEIIGKEFSTALDDSWVEVYKLKKLGGSKDKDEDKKASADVPSDKPKEEKSGEAKNDK